MQRRHNPPENEVPGAVSFAAVLGRTGDAAVAVTDMYAYSTGLNFNLAVRLRQPDPQSNHGRGLHDALFGGRFGDQSAEGTLLLGFGYPDGRAATNIGRGQPFFDVPPDQPTLSQGGGGGGGRTYDLRFFLHPLPGPGDLTIVCAWPARGIAETQTVIGGDLIAAGVAAVTELWPWEPEAEPDEASPPPRPDVPPGSWFASHGPS